MRKIANKKGNISGLQGLLIAVIMFGLIGIIGAFFGLIQSEVETDINSTTGPHSYAMNNSASAQEAQGKIFDKLPLAGTVIVMVFILVLLLGVVGYFMAGKYGGGTVA